MRSSLTMKSKLTRSIVGPQQEASPVKGNTNISSFHFMEQQSELKKYRKMIRELEAMVKEEERKREQAEEKMRMLAERTLLREKEFHSVLEKNFAQFSKLDKTDNETKNKQVFQVFDQIFNNFDEMNEATNKFIEKRYSENMRNMESRVAEIMRVLGQQISKMNRIKNLDRLGLQKSIEQVLLMAKCIEEDSIRANQKMQSQQLKCRLLQEQKQLLIEEIVQKKQLITKLYLENKKMKQERYQHHAKPVSAKSFIIQTKKGSQNSIIQSITQQKCKIQPERVASTGGQTGDTVEPVKINQFITEFNLKNSSKASPAKNKSSRRYNEQAGKQVSKSFNVRRKQIQQPVINKSGDYQTIIQHLRLGLQREKKKNQELSKMLTKLQNQNEEINTTIAQIIKQHKEGSKSQSALEVLVKSEKLFEVIRSLKKRLSMMERPAVSCGWGSENVEEDIFGPDSK